MAQLFTKEFYQAVFHQMEERIKEDFCPTEEDEEVDGYACFEEEPFVDDDDCIEVEMTLRTQNEWEDDSFDHAFGTWHDPCPCWKFGYIYDVDDDVKVYKNGKEIQGWNMDDFWLSFHEERHTTASGTVYTKGEQVETGWSNGVVGEFLYYDSFNEKYHVKVGNEERVCDYIHKPKKGGEE